VNTVNLTTNVKFLVQFGIVRRMIFIRSGFGFLINILIAGELCLIGGNMFIRSTNSGSYML